MPEIKPALWRTLTRWGIPAGVLLMLAGLALYDIYERLQFNSPLFLAFFGAGAVLFGGGILLNLRWLWSGISGRKFLVGLNVWFMVGLAGLLLLISNAIVGGTPQTDAWSLDLTRSGVYGLSPKTRNILNGLQQDVQITVIMGDGLVPVSYRDTVDVGTKLKDLVQLYRAASRRVHAEVLDAYRDKVRADEVAARIKGQMEANSVIVECGEKGEKSKHIPFADLVDLSGANPQSTPGFQGEEKLSSAIQSVTEAKQTAVYFLTGHGEMDIKSGPEVVGQLVIELQRDNDLVKPLNLRKERAVPADCDLLVIAGPKADFTDAEVQSLRDYLEKNGRLFVLARPRANGGKMGGLGRLLADYNVQVRDDEIVILFYGYLGTQQVLSYRLAIAEEDYGYHPIVNDLKKVNCAIDEASPVKPSMPEPGASQFAPAGPAHPYSATTLMRSGKSTYGKLNPIKDRKYDPREDEKGPLSLGVAVQRRPKPGAPDESSGKGPRLVVLGSCNVLSDAAITNADGEYGDDRALVMNCVNWLVNKETKLGIPPQKTDRHEMTAGPAAFRAVFFITILAMPLAAAVAGGLVWWMRRR